MKKWIIPAIVIAIINVGLVCYYNYLARAAINDAISGGILYQALSTLLTPVQLGTIACGLVENILITIATVKAKTKKGVGIFILILFNLLCGFFNPIVTTGFLPCLIIIIVKIKKKINCPVCGVSIPAKSEFCSSCGSDLRKPLNAEPKKVICPKCGKTLPPGTAFCNKCGTDLREPINNTVEVVADTDAALAPVKEDFFVCPKCGMIAMPEDTRCSNCKVELIRGERSGK